MPDHIPDKDIYSVSRLNREVRFLLEGNFPLLWIEGEISNFANPSSGHWYFSLKDDQAQVRCAMFRNRNMHLRFRPKNGLQVRLRARVGLYEGRGEFQLIGEHMEEAGDGALRREFEALQQKLDQEGLFELDRKKALPELPKCLGVITSPSGAAIHDVLSVLLKRFPSLPVIIYPSAVQGETAGQEIAKSIQLAEQRQECDLLLITRGGGSLEDLWAFNEEIVARAIANCSLPVVSAIGHETDITIADFVADYRAPTPSAAAEHISPDQQEWRQIFISRENDLHRAIRQIALQAKQKIQFLETRLKQLHPGNQLKQWAQRIDELELRLQRSVQQCITQYVFQVTQQSHRLLQQNPSNLLQQLQERHKQLAQRLHQAMQGRLRDKHLQLGQLVQTLDIISPLATLERGYAILQKDNDEIVTSRKQLKIDDSVTARLTDGIIKLKVEKNIS